MTSIESNMTKKLYLFGYPISHSATPFLHNKVFSYVDPSMHYTLCDTHDVFQPHFKRMVREDPDFAGAAVTMPLKVAITDPKVGILDELSPSAKAIGAVNTIVVESDPSKPSGRKFVGTNSDYLGIRNSLLRSLSLESFSQTPAAALSPAVSAVSSFPPHAYASFIIGGGGTARSSIYALTLMNLSPIYLINRDRNETRVVREAFPALDIRPLHSVEEWKKERLGEGTRPIPVAVGCIPAVEPKTNEEKMVYDLAKRFLCTPFRPATMSEEEDDKWLPPPIKPHFLEMAYKPRLTPMLKTAEACGWVPVGGVQASIEQGFAQERMWLVGSSSAEVASLVGDNAPIPLSVEAEARALVEGMDDVKVDKKEKWGGKPPEEPARAKL